MIGRLRERLGMAPTADFFGLLQLMALLTVASGYLLSILSSYGLTLWPFLLFTAINLAWVALFWLLQRPNNRSETTTLLLGGMTALAAADLFCLPLGTSFDWILPVVTTAVVALARGWRPVVVVIPVFLLASIGALRLVGSPWRDITNTLAQTLSAYLFAAIFAAVIRRQLELRERAEALAAAVSRANVELERAHEELRARASQAEELTISRERNRMAREIHDTLGHYLTILAVQLETALKLEEHGDPSLNATLRDARRVAAECLAEVRRSVAALRPGDIAALSVAGALRRLVDESAALEPGVEITLDVDEPEVEAPLELRAALYRCAQEALTNVRKHADATKVLVRLRVNGGDAREVELTVLDNGLVAGVETEHSPGFGLLGMRERIALLGGTAQAGPEPGRGWRVEVRAPLDAKDGEQPTILAAQAPASAPEDA
jgi:signal transduction histidine kinase